jgi:hypothetical protein
VVASASDMPAALVDEVIEEMAERMSGSTEARSCAGLSFTFSVVDLAVAPAHYSVGAAGRVRLTRDDATPSTFHFTGPAQAFDVVLSGRQSALAALLRRSIRLQGSLTHVRQLLRMMPSVHRAYNQARADLVARHSAGYDFRF